MARTRSKAPTDDRTVTPIKDPVARNDEALDLERETARRQELEAQRTELEAQVDSRSAERELRGQRPSRRKRPFRGRQTL